MIKTTFRVLLPLAAGAILAPGCVTSHRAEVREPATIIYPSGELVMTEPPPEPIAEVAGLAPDQRHVWVQGYWMHPNERWVWVPGHWDEPPRVGATWVPGHWDRKQGGGWIWTPGYWD